MTYIRVVVEMEFDGDVDQVLSWIYDMLGPNAKVLGVTIYNETGKIIEWEAP